MELIKQRTILESSDLYLTEICDAFNFNKTQITENQLLLFYGKPHFE